MHLNWMVGAYFWCSTLWIKHFNSIRSNDFSSVNISLPLTEAKHFQSWTYPFTSDGSKDEEWECYYQHPELNCKRFTSNLALVLDLNRHHEKFIFVIALHALHITKLYIINKTDVKLTMSINQYWVNKSTKWTKLTYNRSVMS